MANIRPTGSAAAWNPKTPTGDLKGSPIMTPNAQDDPECVPGKDSPFTPRELGSRKASGQGPFGVGGKGNF